MNSKKNINAIICPECQINCSLINSFSNSSLSSQILLSLNCLNQTHMLNKKKNINKNFYNAIQQCSIHKDKFVHYQCTACDTFLCDECSKKHKEEIPSHTQIEFLSKSNKKCHIHQEALLFNCDTCKQLLCVKCKSGGNHSGHTINDNIYENYFYYTKKSKLEDFIKSKKDQVKQIDDLIQKLFVLKGIIQKEIYDFSEILDNSQFFQDIIDDYFVIDGQTPQSKIEKNQKELQKNKLGASFNKIFSQIKKDNYSMYELKNTFNFNTKIDLIRATKNNNVITGINKQTISIFKVETQKYIGTIIVKEKFTNFLEILEGKNLAVVKENNEIDIFDLNQFTRIGVLKAHREAITSIYEFLNSKRLVSSSLDKTIKIWSLVDYSCIKVITEQFPITNMSISKKQPIIFCLLDQITTNNICIFDMKKKNLISKIYLTCQYSDSKILLYSPNIIIICNIKNEIAIIEQVKLEINYLTGHTDKITNVIKLKQKSSNKLINKYIASSSLDQTIKIWNPILRLLLYTIELKCIPEKIIPIKYGFITGVFSDKSFKIFNNEKLITSHVKKEHLCDILQLKNKSIMVISDTGSALIYH